MLQFHPATSPKVGSLAGSRETKARQMTRFRVNCRRIRCSRVQETLLCIYAISYLIGERGGIVIARLKIVKRLQYTFSLKLGGVHVKLCITT